MGVDSLLNKWWNDRHIKDNFQAYRTLAPRAEESCALPDWLDEGIAAALAARGIHKLWTHQVEAANLIRQGQNAVLITPTASGKTMAYNLPVLQAIREDAGTRALYIFPTKALAQDQYHEFMELAESSRVKAAVHTYDGDTAGAIRRTIRDNGHVVMTNPDMLHSAILPHHNTWMRMFASLRYVVIDEVHSFRGIFGSHMANVIRRLKRIAEFYGSRPVFCLCSATIANPGELAAKLIDDQVTVVERNGSPSGRRHILLYNPPVVNRELGVRASAVKQALSLVLDALEERLALIVFASSRLKVELLLKYLREAVEKRHLDPACIQSYRGGYLPDRRREIEKGIREGKIRCVVATNALELGIDIGSLDVSVVVGYPGTQAGLWQQWGRAGRRLSDAISVLVASSGSVDQYMIGHPDFLLGKSAESALIDPDNPFILADHMKCAAFELPFQDGDAFGAGRVEATARLLSNLSARKVLNRSGNRYYWMSDAYPAGSISLRNIPGENFVLIDRERQSIVAEVDFISAHTMLHEGAIHNVEGEQYLVKELDYPGRRALAEKVISDYYTDAETHVQIKLLGRDREDLPGRGLGDAAITERVVGFKKIRFFTSENVGYGEVNLPELTMHTTAAWLDATSAARRLSEIPPQVMLGALSGFARAITAMAAVHLMCDFRDLGFCTGDLGNPDASMKLGRATIPQADAPFQPAVFIYDRRPGGTGLAPRLHEVFPAVLAAALELVGDCRCEEGCPACIGPSAETVSGPYKKTAIQLGRLMLEGLGGGSH